MRTITKEQWIGVNNELWKINAAGKGIYPHILNPILEQLSAMLSYHSKVTVIRMDLSNPIATHNNLLISKFVDAMNKWIKRKYGVPRLGHAWAREVETSKGHHYHVAIMVDGSLIKSGWDIVEKAKIQWEHLTAFLYCDDWETAKGRIHHAGAKTINRGNDQERLQAGYWLSYFAKVRTKGNRPPQTKDYSTSRLKPKKK